MHNNSLVSILIVAYNPGNYLRNTLQSCIDQTHVNTEILVLDNDSSEDISKYCPKSEKIRLIKSEKNIGPYNGLNLLLEQAQWEYIAIQDHDDIWHSEKLERQVQFLETHPEYIWSWSKTVMFYEWDRKYFEYTLGEKNYYTIHPSLVFRNINNFRYDTTETEYMCDAWSLKNNLCHGEKIIYNIDESLTLHVIKKWSTNYSYKWYKFNLKNIKRVYKLHTVSYASLTLWWELMRKLYYPILQKTWLGRWIDTIERIPFRLFWNTIKTTQWDEWWSGYMES